MTESTVRKIYESLASEDEGRACRDIPEEASDEQPGNFLKHVVSLGLTKTGDGIANPKLTLAWLITALNAATGPQWPSPSGMRPPGVALVSS